MKKTLRNICIILVALAFCYPAEPAWAGSAPAQDGKAALKRWSDWWMNEVGRQAVPTPQMLYVIGQNVDWLYPSDDIYVFPSGIGYRHEWHQANAGLLSTEAFVLPSAVQHVHEKEISPFLARLPAYAVTLPAMWLKPSQESENGFHWLKDVSVPASIRPTVFNGSSYEEGNFFEMRFPKQLSPSYQSTTLHNAFFDPSEIE